MGDPLFGQPAYDGLAYVILSALIERTKDRLDEQRIHDLTEEAYRLAYFALEGRAQGAERARRTLAAEESARGSMASREKS
jgi:hypothetical protein